MTWYFNSPIYAGIQHFNIFKSKAQTVSQSALWRVNVMLNTPFILTLTAEHNTSSKYPSKRKYKEFLVLSAMTSDEVIHSIHTSVGTSNACMLAPDRLVIYRKLSTSWMLTSRNVLKMCGMKKAEEP